MTGNFINTEIKKEKYMLIKEREWRIITISICDSYYANYDKSKINGWKF